MTQAEPRYRSGAVARMLRMPVATLRVWERRYQVCAPQLTASGQRLYSAADVQRLALIQQLVAHGHAIGTLAVLDAEALHAVAATHAGTLARAQVPQQTQVLRVHVADAGLRERIAQAAWRDRVEQAWVWADGPELADIHVEHFARLLPDARPRSPGPGIRWGVVLRYAAAPVVMALQDAGAMVLREPADDAAWLSWWSRLCQPSVPTVSASPAGTSAKPTPPRWDEATLQAFAGLSTTIACECPKHLAELLIQLGQFEAYSADCASRGPEDRELHQHLQQVSGQARVLLEDALARVAEAEGLISPRSAA